jgi:hypothetical protein
MTSEFQRATFTLLNRIMQFKSLVALRLQLQNAQHLR